MLYLHASDEKEKLSDLRSDLLSLPTKKRLHQYFVLKLFYILHLGSFGGIRIFLLLLQIT